MPRGHILDLRWNALLNEFRRSGLTQAEFCQRRGISIHSFRKRLYRGPPPEPPPPHPPPPPPAPSPPLPAPPAPSPATTTATADSPRPLELLLGNGRRIAVAPGFDPHTL